jgi:hypothetical protein
MKFHKNYIILFLIFLFIANSLILIKRNNLNLSILNFFERDIKATTPTTREYSRLSTVNKIKVMQTSIKINSKKDKKIFYELQNFTPIEKAIIAFNVYPRELDHAQYAGVGTKKIIVALTYEQFINYGSEDTLAKRKSLLAKTGCTLEETMPKDLDNDYKWLFRSDPNTIMYHIYICE